MKIFWTDEAITENQKNIDYLIENWDTIVLEKYLIELEKTTNFLKKDILTGMFDNDLGLYKILVVEQIYLFYEVHEDNLYIVSIWNNHRFPFWL